MKRGVVAAIAVLLAACTVAPTGEDAPGPQRDIRWPSAPEAERIRFVRMFAGPEDLGIRASFMQRLVSAVAGTEPTHMVRPYAIDVEGERILVGDPGANAVHLYDLDRRSYRRVTAAGDQALETPVGVALETDRFYVSDSSLEQVFVFDLEGRLLAAAGGLQRPTGMAFDAASGRLFVADTLGHRIVVFDKQGKQLFAFGERGSADGQFNFPSHLHLWDGRLLVNDNMNFRLQVFDADGRHLRTFGRHGDASGYLSQPKGIAVDAGQHVYVAGATIDRVQIFSMEGEFLLAFGSNGEGPGEFLMPAGVATVNDLIYVADSYNRRIQVFRYVGSD